jgi:hypothetical protein
MPLSSVWCGAGKLVVHRAHLLCRKGWSVEKLGSDMKRHGGAGWQGAFYLVGMGKFESLFRFRQGLHGCFWAGWQQLASSLARPTGTWTGYQTYARYHSKRMYSVLGRDQDAIVFRFGASAISVPVTRLHTTPLVHDSSRLTWPASGGRVRFCDKMPKRKYGCVHG